MSAVNANDIPCSRAPDFWFTEDRHVAQAIAQECRDCPLVEPCADWGVTYERHGVWGGLLPSERAVIRRRRGITLQHPPTGITYPQRERRAS